MSSRAFFTNFFPRTELSNNQPFLVVFFRVHGSEFFSLSNRRVIQFPHDMEVASEAQAESYATSAAEKVKEIQSEAKAVFFEKTWDI